MFELIILLVSTTVLAYLGAGVFPYVMPILAGILSITGFFILRRENISTIPLQTAAAILLLVFISFTILPLPGNPSFIFGKNRFQQQGLVQEALVEYKEAGLIKNSDTSFSLSRNRAGTIRTLILWITGIWMVVLASRLSDERKKQYLIFLCNLGFIIALLGLAGQWLWPQGKTLWWIFSAAHGEPVACFINRNHFAGFLALLCPATICLASEYMSQKRYFASLYWSAVFGVIVIAILMSMSRGAWIAAGTSLLITAIILALKYDNRTRILLAIILFFLMTTIFAIPSYDLRERAETLKDPIATSSAQMRFHTWRDAIKISKDYPLVGTGANGFRMLFPQYRTDTLRKEFKHIENEYVQTFIEYGVIGTLLILVALFALIKPSIKSLTHPEKLSIIQISAIAGCSAAAAHAVLDFAIRIPLYFLVFLIFLLFTSDEDRKRIQLPTKTPIWTLGAVSLFLVCLVSITGHRKPEMDIPDYVQQANPQELAKCLEWSPTSWHVWFHLGNAAMASRIPGTYELGAEFLEQALDYDPNNYRLVEQLCRVQLHMKDIPAALETYKRLRALRDWKRIHELDKIIAEQNRTNGEDT